MKNKYIDRNDFSKNHNINKNSNSITNPEVILKNTKELLSKSPFASAVFSNGGKLIYINPAFKKLFGYNLAEIPTTAEFLNNIIHIPSYRKNIKRKWNFFLNKDTGRKIIPELIKVRNKNSKELEIKFSIIRTSESIYYAFFQDITEKQKTANEILESKERYEKLFNSANDAIFLMKDDRFIDCNPKTLEMFKCKRNQIINHSPFEFSPLKQPDGKDSRIQALKKITAAQKNQQQVFEWLHCKYDGTPFYAEVSLNVVELESGKYLQAIVRDISERKEFEHRLKRRVEFENLLTKISASFVNLKEEALENKIKNAFKQIGDFLNLDLCLLFSFSHDYSTISCVTQWNRSGKKGIEKKFNALSTVSRKWWLKKIRIFEPLVINSLKQIPKSEKVWIYELNKMNIKSFVHIPIIQHDKLVGFVALTAVQNEWNIDKGFISLLKIFGEIIANSLQRKEIEEDLKLSEARFRSLYENAKLGIYRTTFEGKFVLANPALIKMFGCNSFEELAEQDIAREFYVNSEDRKKLLKLANTKGEFDGFETLIRPKRGDIINVRIYGKVVKSKDKKTKFLEGVVEDITEKKQSEKVLLESKERAENSEKLKSEFLAQMSHEIRTPINTILSFSSLLKSELYNLVSEDLRQSFSLMERAGKRITRTIDLILNMSEMQTGTYEPSKRNFDLFSHVVEPLYFEYRGVAQTKGVLLTLKKSESNYELQADEYTVSQIFSNLLDNAVKYTDKGKIELKLKRLKNKNIVVEIIDTGVGISKEYLPNLFRPFSQEEQGYTRKFEGNGLGLALVKRYCEINNADIQVQSNKGKGTKFKITFQ